MLAGYWRATEGTPWNVGLYLLAGVFVLVFLPLFTWVYARIWFRSFLAVAAAAILLLFAHGLGRRLGGDAFLRQVEERLDDYELAAGSLRTSTASHPTVADPHPDLAWASLRRDPSSGDLLTFALRADPRNLRIQRWRQANAARTPLECGQLIRPGWCWVNGPEGK